MNFLGDQRINLKFGYGKLIEYLVSFLQNSSIHLQEAVKNINWAQNVTIRTLNATYTANYCIVTIPLGIQSQ